MGTTPPPALPFVPARAYPRLKYTAPVVIDFAGRSFIGTTEEIAIGGLGARCDAPPPAEADLSLLFNLPTGPAVRTSASVRYVLPGRFGAQFKDLPPEARTALQDYTRKVLGYARRGGRVAKRLLVTLRSVRLGVTSEELAETLILSRNGGRLVCRARFKIAEELRLYWPERRREAQIRVVFRQLCGSEEMADIGFEFLQEHDFWGPELGL